MKLDNKDKSNTIMKDFYTALQHCLNAIDLGIDLESCLSLYPEYQDQLRLFFQKWNGARDNVNGLSERAVEQFLFDQVLDECIKAVGRGESPESCYNRYPSYARRLRPWLIAVAELPKLRRDGRLQIELTYDDFFVPEVPFTQALDEYIQAAGRKESDLVLARYPYYADKLQFWADKVPNPPQSVLPLSKPASRKRPSVRMGNLLSPNSLQVPVAVLLAVLIFLFSGLGLARASAATVPGEVLYPLKLVVEQIHMNIVSDNEKEDLKEQFAQERRKEASVLIHADIKQDVAFDGEVTSVEDSKLVVSDVVILLNDFKGDKPAVNKGEIVHVEGYTGQSGVVVKRLDVRSSHGPDKTFVAAQPIPTIALANLPSATPFSAQISPTLAQGAVVAFPTSASFDKDKPSNSGIEPTSVPKSVPTSQPTAVPTQVPTLAPTSMPTAAPTLAATPNPTAKPTDVPTSEPTAAPTDEPTSEPTSEPTTAPTDEVHPTAEPPSVAPTDVPNPTLTNSQP